MSTTSFTYTKSRFCSPSAYSGRQDLKSFTQPVSRFLSMRNIAKDVIVISRMSDIVPDIESALDRNKKFAQEAGMEFVTPSVLPKVDNKEVRTPQQPRYILLLLDERPPQHA